MYKVTTIAVITLSIFCLVLSDGCTPPVRRLAADEPKQQLNKKQTPSKSQTGGIEDAAKKIKILQESASNGKYKPSPDKEKKAGKKPWLSWRVHLLPFLEEQTLYEQFRLEEPWDSQHNKKLIEKMPAIYRSPVNDVPQGRTTFLAPVSKYSAISNDSRGIRFTDLRDGASKTILFVEVKPECAVTWTKPQDINFDARNPMRCLDTKQGFTAVFCDGSVHRIPGDIDPDTLRKLVDRRDGEVVTTSF